MVYTELTKKAMKICFSAHKDQTDKSGLPYVFHPFHLAESMDDEFSCALALLHDVVEDSDTTIDDIRKMGFPDEITEALSLLTHERSVPYMEYVRKISENPLARKVKIADLTHNSDLTRMDTVDEYALRRNEKYALALKFLRGE